MRSQSERSPALTLDEVLNDWLPVRIQGLQSMLWALDIADQLSAETPVTFNIGEHPPFESTLSFFTNPMVAAGYVHARALLEFMGVSAKDGNLIQVKRRHSTDVAIEHYSVAGVSLERVSLNECLGAINMPDAIAEWALVAIVEIANKFYAHVTTGEVIVMAMDRQVRVALDGVLVLLHNHLFSKLQIVKPIAFVKGTVYSCNTCNQNCSSEYMNK